ncbi:MAG: hypothetical protein V1760_02845 [Candidatus Peregrinibacteria bacterium]
MTKAKVNLPKGYEKALKGHPDAEKIEKIVRKRGEVSRLVCSPKCAGGSDSPVIRDPQDRAERLAIKMRSEGGAGGFTTEDNPDAFDLGHQDEVLADPEYQDRPATSPDAVEIDPSVPRDGRTEEIVNARLQLAAIGVKADKLPPDKDKQ